MTTATAVRGKRVRHAETKQPHLSREQRVALGKAARAAVPRSSHAEFTAAPERPDPVAVLESQAATRVPELLPIRYGRMALFAVHLLPRRGAADGQRPGSTPSVRPRRAGLRRRPPGNFGLFASPERHLVFDINDFDETLPGPWEWDVKRLATSLEIAARANGYSGEDRAASVVVAAVARYRNAMRRSPTMRRLDVWYAHADADRGPGAAPTSSAAPPAARTWRARSAKARTKDNLGALSRFAACSTATPAHRRTAADRAAP